MKRGPQGPLLTAADKQAARNYALSRKSWRSPKCRDAIVNMLRAGIAIFTRAYHGEPSFRIGEVFLSCSPVMCKRF